MIEDIIKKVLKEATSTSTNAKGGYVPPMVPAIRPFKDDVMAPFTDPVSEYMSPELEYDSYDGYMTGDKKTIIKKEKKAKKISNYIKTHPYATFSDDDGNIINQNAGKSKIVPIKEWVELDTINEDLAVWFGTKKKPKGSKQPKGPWVNICRRDKDGKHPPCGRPDTSKGAYPKCRAAGVAGKMSDSAKRNACSQKRKAEKKDTQTGKGQKPVMTSYKPKKKRTQNESLDLLINNILKGF